MPTLLKDKVTINGITFNDALAKPVGAIEWGCDTLDGWDRAADIQAVISDVGGSTDGQIIADDLVTNGRGLLASGWATAGTRAETETLMDVIMGDVAPKNVDLVVARYESIPKYVTARAIGERSIARVGPYGFRWVAELLAGDPSKYDLIPPAGSSGTSGVAGQSTGGRSYPRTYPMTYTTITSGSENYVTVTNRGTKDTLPLVTITGPLVKGGWRLSNETTGKQVRFDVGLAAGDVLVIDFKQELATLNGGPVTATIFGDFFPIVRGANVIKLFADYDPAATLTVAIESAWE